MRATRLWVRVLLRSNRAASVFLVLLAGLTGGIVMAAFESADHAASSITRFREATRSYDAALEVCPPGTSPADLEDFRVIRVKCVSPAAAERLRSVLATYDGVAATAAADPFAIGLLDSTAPNGWGYVTNGNYAFRTPGVPIVFDGPVLLAGHLPRVDAPDEIIVQERFAKESNLHVGSVVRLAGWTPEHLDAANTGALPPEGPVFTSTVVGIVRSFYDVAAKPVLPLDTAYRLGSFSAGPAWAGAHLDQFARWSTSVLVRVSTVDPDAGVARLERQLRADGWVGGASPLFGVATVADVRSTVNLDRHAWRLLGLIVLAAGSATTVLAARRQFAAELADRATLAALGFSRRHVLVAVLLRGLVVVLGALPVAVIVAVGLSKALPIGTARKLDLDPGLRISGRFAALTLLGLLAVLAIAACLAVVARTAQWPSAPRRRVGAGPRSSASIVARSVVVGATSVLSTAAILLAAVAMVVSALVIGSFDRLIAEPFRYGAFFDIAIDGGFANQAEFDAATARARALPEITAAVGVQVAQLSIDGDASKPFASITPLFGVMRDVPVVRGRLPTADDEVALSPATLRALRKQLGGELTLTGDHGKPRAHIVGEAITSAVCGCDEEPAGYLTAPTVRRTAGLLWPGTLAVRFRPEVPSPKALAAITSTFHGIAGPSPSARIRNVRRVVWLPWLAAALVGVLALSTLAYALVALLARHRGDLETLSALGFDRRRHRALRSSIGLRLVAGGLFVGIPLGLLVGRSVWAAFVRWIDVLPGARIPLSTLVAIPIAGAALALALAAAVGRSTTSTVPHGQGAATR